METSDIESRLLGWSGLDEEDDFSRDERTVVSAIIALVAVLPIFIGIELVKRYRKKQNTMTVGEPSNAAPLLAGVVDGRQHNHLL